MLNLKDFDYILWKDSEGRCFVKVKFTDEVSEVNEQVFRTLRNEEKRLYREIELNESLKSEDADETIKDKAKVMFPVSYDIMVENDEESQSSWLAFQRNFEEELIASDLEEKFVDTLTEIQKEVFYCVLIDGETHRDFAERKGMTHQNVSYTVSCIRKKFKKFFV